jgi:hypothetical protein
LIVLRRKMRGRLQLTHNDRWFFIQRCRLSRVTSARLPSGSGSLAPFNRHLGLRTD